MKSTILEKVRLEVHEGNFVHHLKHAFTNKTTFLAELMQNAYRSGSEAVWLDCDASSGTLTVTDRGSGVNQMQNLLTAFESGWDGNIKSQLKPFGLGFLAALHAARHVSVESRGKKLAFDTDDALDFRDIPVVTSDYIGAGTVIRLSGLSVTPSEITQAVQQYAQGFPIDVFLNGERLPRPHATDTIAMVATSIGMVSVTGIHRPFESNRYWQPISKDKVVYLQGIEVYETYTSSRAAANIVHLDPARFFARIPDRDKLVDENLVIEQIDKVIVEQARAYLMAERQRLGDASFINAHFETLRELSLHDITNSIDYLPAEMLMVAGAPHAHSDWYNCSGYKGAAVHRSDVAAGKIVLIDEAMSEDLAGTAALHLLAHLKGWLIPFRHKFKDEHWANDHIVDASCYETVEKVKVTPSGLEPTTESFRGWFGAEVAFCQSVTIEYEGHKAEVDDMIVSFGNMLYVPAGAGPGCAAAAVVQACDYDTESGLDEAGLEDDAAHLAAIINLRRSGDACQLLQTVLHGSSLYRYPALHGQTFAVTVDQNGCAKVTQQKPKRKKAH